MFYDSDIVIRLWILFLCFWLSQVTKVVVEAESVMMNGAVQGMCGTAGLALAAATHDTPFIVLCHTYKFSNNDLTDSLVVNELGKFLCFYSDGKSVMYALFSEYLYFWITCIWKEDVNAKNIMLTEDFNVISPKRMERDLNLR